MGCGSSRQDVVKSMGSAEDDNNKMENSNNTTNNSTTRKGSKKSKQQSNNTNNKKSNEAKESGTNGGLVNNHNDKGGGGGGDDDTKDSSLNSSITSQASTIPASDELYQNHSHDGKGNNVISRPLLGKLPPLKPPRSARVGFFDQNTNDDSEINQNIRHVPVAFEVSANDNDEGGEDAVELALIKRHPPRRLRKLVEEKPDEDLPVLTHESLEEKVQQANERRKQVLTQRVASARQKSARVRKPLLFDASGINPDDFGEIESAS